MLEVGVGGAQEGLPQVVDAVAHVGRVRVVGGFLRRVQGRVVAVAETVLVDLVVVFVWWIGAGVVFELRVKGMGGGGRLTRQWSWWKTARPRMLGEMAGFLMKPLPSGESEGQLFGVFREGNEGCADVLGNMICHVFSVSLVGAWANFLR